MVKLSGRNVALYLTFLNLISKGFLKPTLSLEEESATLLTTNALELDSVSSSIIETISPTTSLPLNELGKIENLLNESETTIDKGVKTLDGDEYVERVEYAKKMLTFMNQTIDPCDDFYEYSCGNWKNYMDEHDAKHKRNYLLDIFYKHLNIVEQLFEKPLEELNTEHMEEMKMAKLHYQSCLNAHLYPFKKSEEYLKIIKEIGGFPAVDDKWNPDEFSWFNMSSHLSNYGAEGFIKEKIFPIYPYPPYFEVPTIGFDMIAHKENIESNETRSYKLNEKRMLDYLRAYGVDEEKSSQIVSEIFEFWKAVLNVTEEYSESSDVCKLLTINKTEVFTEWNNFFEIAWNGIDFNTTFDDCPCDYLYVKLDEICKEHSSAVANYLALKFIYHMDARLIDSKFQKEYCIKNVFEAYRYLIDKIYLKKYFDKDIQTELSVIVKEVRQILKELLERADWLDESTRIEALEKENLLTSQIGKYEDDVVTETIIGQLKNIDFSMESYEKNNIELQKIKKSVKRFSGLNHESLNNETKPLELLLGLQVNSFYYNIDNSIYVMAGILHPPAYHKSWPKVLKYGTIGFLIGHELTHGFDTTGSNYDSKGEERNWWSETSGNVFTNRTDCYVQHYNKYFISEINRNVNGNQTKDENIADAGGLREALIAYHNNIDKSKEDLGNEPFLKEEMPGLSLTPDQLFFLGFAQLWCSSYKEEHYWEEISNDHPMDRYRVIGTLTNMHEFATAFNCPLGSKMNPTADKCNVW